MCIVSVRMCEEMYVRVGRKAREEDLLHVRLVFVSVCCIRVQVCWCACVGDKSILAGEKKDSMPVYLSELKLQGDGCMQMCMSSVDWHGL